jgi:dTDP-4-amino-4,6-dideoxygalactose transaminase
MPVPLLDLKAQHATIRDEVVAAMMRVVDDQTVILGDAVERLEQEVAELSNTKHAIGCANGTDAILLSLRALGVGAGDEVITTPFTFFATAGAIHNVGARPVFADIDPVSFNLNADAAAAVKSGKSKAVIPVDLFGQMAELERFAKLGLPVLEDAAQSIGATREVEGKSVKAGEAATIGTFSFFPSKNLGGYGDGGMIVTQDDEIALRLRKMRVHGGLKTYHHEMVGYNSRLDALQAVVLSTKLPHLEKWSAARREHARYYDQAFADLGGVQTPAIDGRNESIYNQYTLRAEKRDKLQEHLKAKGIGSAIYYPVPLHLQPCFDYLGYKKGAFPESEKAAAEVISLPVYPELTRAQQDEVVDAVRDFYRH